MHMLVPRLEDLGGRGARAKHGTLWSPDPLDVFIIGVHVVVLS